MDYNNAVQTVNTHMSQNFHKFANILDTAGYNKEEYFLGNITDAVRIWKKDAYGEIEYLSDDVTIHEGVELFKRYVLNSKQKYDYGDDIVKEIKARINDENVEPKIGPDQLRYIFTQKIANFAKSCELVDYAPSTDGTIKCLGKVEVGPYKGYSIFRTTGSPSNRENVEYETDVVEKMEDIQDQMAY